jgi:hypothetical protein
MRKRAICAAAAVCAALSTLSRAPAHATETDGGDGTPAPAPESTAEGTLPPGPPTTADAADAADAGAEPSPAPATTASVTAEPPLAPRESPVASACATAATCPNTCRVAVELGPRFGISVNGDQWLVGAGLRSSVPCFGTLGFGPLLAFGLGGNHLTVRSAGRFDYLLWFDAAHTFGIYPILGASLRVYVPVGRFASFCRQVHLDECSGYDLGGELGGGVRYRALGVDAVVGFGGLPVVTILGGLSLPAKGVEPR